MTDAARDEPFYGYVNETLRSEADLLRAIPSVRTIASNPANYIRTVTGEDVLDKLGIVPGSADPAPLLPWVRIRLLPRGAASPIVLTYEVRVIETESPVTGIVRKVLRVLSMELDLIAPSNAPIMPDQVNEKANEFYRGAMPLVKPFFPLHDNVGSDIHAHAPLPRVMQGSDTIHMRTAVLMRFSAADDDVTNAQNAKRRVQLFGPNNRPL